MQVLRQIVLLHLLILVSFQLSSQTIAIMTYNIRYDTPNDKDNWWENRKSEVASLLEYYHPDLLGIQEGLLHQVEYIKESTSHYKYIGAGRDDGDKKGEYCAIFYDSTKFELLIQKTFWLSNNSDTVSIGWDASMERICTYGKFKNKYTNDSLHIFNTHFDHMGKESRLMSADLILRKIEEYRLDNLKVVVMGDLNCEMESLPIQTLKEKLSYGAEVSETEFYGPESTFNGFNTNLIPDKRIDYIFVHNLNVYSYRHIDDRRKNNLWVSDHLPVLIKIN